MLAKECSNQLSMVCLKSNWTLCFWPPSCRHCVLQDPVASHRLPCPAPTRRACVFSVRLDLSEVYEKNKSLWLRKTLACKKKQLAHKNNIGCKAGLPKSLKWSEISCKADKVPESSALHIQSVEKQLFAQHETIEQNIALAPSNGPRGQNKIQNEFDKNNFP